MRRFDGFHNRDVCRRVDQYQCVTDVNLPSAALGAIETPTATLLTNVNITCDGVWDDEKIGKLFSPCSEESACLNGDLGVYCHCYKRQYSLEEVIAVLLRCHDIFSLLINLSLRFVRRS